MTGPPDQPDQPDQRIEILDDDGVPRVVLGRLDAGADAGATMYGLSLRDADGAERVALSIDDHGPTLVFVRGGNIAIQLGIDDPVVSGDQVGAHVTLADGEGTPVLSVSVESDGSLSIRRALVPPLGDP